MSDLEDMFEFDGYNENWPGVYVPPEHKRVIKKVKIVQELVRREKYTPDFKALRMRDDILVFVYDEFRLRGAYNPILRESKYLGFAVSASDLYVLKGGVRMPVLLDNNRKSDKFRGRIKGEVYAVPPETLLRIDQMKFNGTLYRRHERNFFLTDQSYKTKDGSKKSPSVRAWCYLGIPDQWKDDNIPTQPMFSHAGSKDKKYFEYFVKSAQEVY